MIKKGKEQNETGQASNRILANTFIEGEIRSEGDFRVDGTLKGKINIGGKLVIGEKGHVEGEIKCTYANVSGQLHGTIKVEELLSLQATAHVKGDVMTNKLSVEPGAEFTGSCSMGSVIREMTNEGEQQQAKKGKSREEATA
jgi:cytoskeletal protein CcmA (bactofilin family)